MIKNFIKNIMIKSLISAVLFGLFYSFILEKNMNWGVTLQITVIYFLLSCLFHYIASKFRKSIVK